MDVRRELVGRGDDLAGLLGLLTSEFVRGSGVTDGGGHADAGRASIIGPWL